MLRIVGLHTSTENSNIDNFSKQPVLAKRVVTTIYNLKICFSKEKMLILGYVCSTEDKTSAGNWFAIASSI